MSESESSAEVVAGRYQVLGELGSGTMGVVWLAHDTVLDRTVALKELRPPAGINRTEAIERFLTEARAAARLQHPSIVTVYDVAADGDRVLMAMEHLDGLTLAQVLDSSGALLPEDARNIGTQIASALAEAHANGIVHRDLKPENVFLLPTGRVVVCDFGLARIGAGTGTQLGTVMGTPGYLAPEQVRGETSGPPADVFAWGSVMYELLTGQPAFGAPTNDIAALLWSVVHNEPAPLDIPTDPDLGSIVHAALAKNSNDRPPDGASLHHSLVGATTLPPRVLAGSMAGGATQSSSLSRAGFLPWVIGGAVALVLILVGTLVLASSGGGQGGNDVATGDTLGDVGEPADIAEVTQPPPTAPPPTPPIALPATRQDPVAASASCTAPTGTDASGSTTSYQASNVLDGLQDTAWRCPGSAVGQSLTVSLGSVTEVTSVGLLPGYAKVDSFDGSNRFFENRRVTAVRYHFDGGTTIDQNFADSPTVQSIPVGVQTQSIRIEILGTTGDGGRDFTPISEVEVVGR
ncbi:protein kinase domain-containing protein [Candidatus Neomicrothrix sp.]|uniref:protein kinase domain-containing protein n=1 Tax=Candidatus Neomicrothrix sp. TaxID=2719034 RepID=UPI002595D8E3|nr:protein kinase [Candidatus Microthrix sp.]HMS49712.1 protein kinase [Candidatus Microthrix sp.]HMT26437.1 protein kinase [Microthrixaceae bacterium]HMT61489.1 protein kinase [Microthrixaceae bacterium]